MQVLETLYEVPSAVLLVFVNNSQNYIDLLASAICTPGVKPKRQVIRNHIVFTLKHFFSNVEPTTRQEVFHKILFPFLLFSKPRQHTAETVWEILEQTADYELLEGCADVWKLMQANDEGDPVEKMARINSAVSSKIAGQWHQVFRIRTQLD